MEFELPPELIAQTPAHPRDHAKLLVYDRASQAITDSVFYDLPKWLPIKTTLVLNNTKVDQCRLLFGNKEIFVLQTFNPTTIQAMVRPGRAFKMGATVPLAQAITATITHVDDEGLRTIQLSKPINDPAFDAYRHTPFPPYIKADESLRAEYQTIYAKRDGSKAAPTAGLHFTPDLLDKVSAEHPIAEITLDVGLGTFAPLRAENISSGTLHSETYHITDDSADLLNTAQSITAVGTTSLRCLEAARQKNSKFQATNDQTDIFIQPGYHFQAVNHLITNFHLPGTSLLLLVEAFVGSRSEIERIYQHAIAQKYRFYSFGDAMLII